MQQGATTRRAAMVAGVAVLAVLSAWLLVSVVGDDASTGSQGSGGGTATTASGGDTATTASGDSGSTTAGSGSGAGQGPGDSSGEASGGSSGGSGKPSGGSSDEPPDPDDVVEHRPAGAEDDQAPLPGEEGFELPGLDREKPPKHLVDQAPEDASANGKVVAGYPVHYLPVPKAATVVSSEVASQGTHVQASLVARCTCSVARMVGFHDKAMARLGMTGAQVPAADGATGRSYHDRNSAVTLTVRRDGKTTTYTLYSVLEAARA